jgi:C_GCAxxG_C_C family probable redox protein
VGEHVMGDRARQSLRLATALAGGIGGTRQEVCGALSGGVLVISGLYGRDALDQDDRLALELAARYRTQFLDAFGETQCARLRDKIYAPDGLGSCAVLVEQAAQILLQLLSETAT